MNILPKRFVINKQKIKTAQWLEMIGCPSSIDATYDGYTGVKYYKFPVTSGARYGAYPDVTKDYEAFKHKMIVETINEKRKPFGGLRVLKLFLDNFATGAKWDTKFSMDFPGRDKLGRVQYARYNEKVVTGNYLSNNIYGFLCALIGIPEKMSKFIARIYSKGFLEPFISGKLPDKKLLKFSDPVSDQQAVSSGYKDFREWKGKTILKNLLY